MRRVVLILVVCVMSMHTWAGIADTPHVAISEVWDAGANPMTETPPGSGIWEYTFILGAGARHEFKITQGNWDEVYPTSGNSWLFADDSGEITVTFNANSLSDGWIPAQNRLGLSTDQGNWTIVGDFGGSEEWQNTAPTMATTSLGHGFYKLTKTLSAGTYDWKAVVTSSWDAIGNDGRGINADKISLTVKQ